MGKGLKTLEQLKAAAAELQARKAPAKPAQTRRINDAHRAAVGAFRSKLGEGR
jgi:hypothetical protein